MYAGSKRKSNIKELLQRNQELRKRFAKDSTDSRVLRDLQKWQSERLAKTYADLRRDQRFARAVKFFLEDLYAPKDLTPRDRQLARAYPKLKRMLPEIALDALRAAIELEILSQELDQQMVGILAAESTITAQTYVEAYRSVAQRPARRHQIGLVVHLGWDLDRMVRNPLYYAALRMAHVPAQMAGFGELQGFLERGFNAFRRMHGARKLIEIIEDRETVIMERIFDGEEDPFRGDD